MNKTFGLLALSIGLVGAGCALMPQTAVKSLGTDAAATSGPVTLRFNAPITAETYSVQGLGNSSIKQAEVRVYEAASSFKANHTNGRAKIALSPTLGTPLVASYSVGVGSSSITIPSLPQGNFVVELNFYTGKATYFSTTTGLPTANQPYTMVAQSEAYVTTKPGVPLAVTFPAVYNTVGQSYNIDTSTFTRGATTSMGFASDSINALYNALSGPSFMDFRIANFNAMVQVSTGSATAGTANKKVLRVMLMPPSGTLFTTSLASDSTSNYYSYYDVNAVNTGTPNATQTITWNWASDLGEDATYSFAYADLALTDDGADDTKFATASTAAARLRTGSISLHLQRGLFNNAATPDIRIVDTASGSSGVVTGGF